MFDAIDLRDRCRKAAADEVAFWSDDELLAASVGVQQALSALAGTNAQLLAELDVRGVTDRSCGTRTAAWVAAQAGVSRRSVRAQIVSGRWLRRLEVTTAAVASGQISADHGEVLAKAVANPRIGEQLAAFEAELIDSATDVPFERWAGSVRQLEAALDQDGGYNPNDDINRNRLRFTVLADGGLSFNGELTAEHALVVKHTVEVEADRLFHKMRNDTDRDPQSLPMPNRSALLAVAMTELILKGLACDTAATSKPVTDVTLVITADPDRACTCGCTTHRPDPTDLDPDPTDLDADGGTEGTMFGEATTVDGTHVRANLAACLLCDPAITALVVDTLGVPLDLGHQHRYANRDQRRALAKRDGGCTFPGCHDPVSWCDAHHVIPWENGGPTDIRNLALLCRYHHGVTHRQGWSMATTANQRFIWTTPTGTALHSQRHHGRPPPAPSAT